MRYLFFLSLFLFLPQVFAKKISIEVGQAKKQRSSLALPSFHYRGGLREPGRKLHDKIKRNLHLSGFFHLIDPKSFIENVNRVSLKPLSQDKNGFDFKKWRALKAQLLIRGAYKTVKGQLELEIYVYYVNTGKIALAKLYKGLAFRAEQVANQFCDDLAQALTGKKSIFSTKIVATVKKSGNSDKGIYTLHWSGENLQKATSFSFKALSVSPAWSPKGDKIAFTSYVYHKKARMINPDLFLLDVKTKKVKLISHLKGMNSGATFHPNGGYIYYTISRGGGAHIYKIDLRNYRASKVVAYPSGTLNVEPDLSEDGRHLAFSSNRSGRPMIYMTDASGRRKFERLTFAGRYNSNPVFSPDGKTLVFASYRKGNDDIYSLDLKSKQIKKLTSYKRKNGRYANHSSPSFSPDGRFIVFSSNRLTSNSQLYIMSSDGSYVRRITHDRYSYESPKWSPFLKP